MRHLHFYILTMLFSLSPNFAIAKSAGKITGAVYVATNNSAENSLVGYRQFADGTLEKIGAFKTGGKGTGLVELFDIPFDPSGLNTFADGIDPLASAYGVWHSADFKNVLVANAGNGTVSSLRVMPDYSLRLNNVVKAGNIKPLAIATHGNLVYVASMGSKKESPNDGNIAGYKISSNGKLFPIKNSTRELGGRPASLEFTPDGKFVVVVEITTGITRVFAVQADGSLSKKAVSSIESPISKGRFFALPIGTDIIPAAGGGHYLFVTETRFVKADGKFQLATKEHKAKYPFLPQYEGQTGSISSYKIDPQGHISLIDADVMAGDNVTDGQQATCWVVVSRDGKRLWATNPLTASLTAYAIAKDGSLSLTEEIAYQAPDLKKYFLDMDLSGDGHFINVISGNTGEVFVFAINHNIDKLRLVGAYPGSAKIHSYGLVTIPANGKNAEKD